jgi:hypothetical protein
VLTSEVLVEQDWVVRFDVLADDLPAFGEVPLGACHFEIVHVHNEEQVEGRMSVARAPLVNRLPTPLASPSWQWRSQYPPLSGWPYKARRSGQKDPFMPFQDSGCLSRGRRTHVSASPPSVAWT